MKYIKQPSPKKACKLEVQYVPFALFQLACVLPLAIHSSHSQCDITKRARGQ